VIVVYKKTMDSQLVSLLQGSDVPALQVFLKGIVASHNLSDILRAVELCCDEKVSLTNSKDAMKAIAGAMDMTAFDNNDVETFKQKVIQCTLSRQSAYEESLSCIYEKIAVKYEGNNMYKQASEEFVRLFDCINDLSNVADSHAVSKSVEYLSRRVDVCVRAARNLSYSDAEGANRLLLRVSDKVADLPAEHKSVLAYKSLYAHLFDLRHEFIRAAQKYLELIRQPKVPDNCKFDCLKSCALCACLADAGPERSTVLSILFKNEMTPRLECYPILVKIQQERILRDKDIAMFENMLTEHQKVPLPGEKMKPLEHAVMMHNLFSAANIYTSIRLSDLALLLRIGKDDAERMASNMIRQKRINARIDQVKDMLFFSNRPDPLAAWDSHIDDMCNAADEAANMIDSKFSMDD